MVDFVVRVFSWDTGWEPRLHSLLQHRVRTIMKTVESKPLAMQMLARMHDVMAALHEPADFTGAEFIRGMHPAELGVAMLTRCMQP